MNWKLKAMIQNLIEGLPSTLSYKAYYSVQRNLGALRRINPSKRLSDGVSVFEHICAQNQTAEHKTFLEIGTGWRLNLPIALWLCGASRIITVDLNPYLKTELVLEDISYIREKQQDIKQLFGRRSQEPLFLERFDRLLKAPSRLGYLLDMMNIQYLAPADAACLDLQAETIDYHVSNTTFEHIQPEILEKIILEGKRVLKKTGLFVHSIDLSDHYSHSDASICAINFLQFSERRWNYYAGNRYAYHNRLRIDDFLDLFSRMGLKILSLDTKISPRCLEELRKGFLLNELFKHKTQETNAAISVQIVACYDETSSQVA